MNRKCITMVIQSEQGLCYEEMYCVVSLGVRISYGIIMEEIGKS